MAAWLILNFGKMDHLLSDNKPKLSLAADNGEVPKERAETTYATAEQAQAWLVALRASLIRDGQLGQPPVRWVSITSRIGPQKVDSHSDIWQMHHVLLDEDGVMNFVHRKRTSDWLGLRDVAQDLMVSFTDSFLTLWNADQMRESFEIRYSSSEVTVEQAMEKLLGLAVSTDMDTFWQRVADNLQKRRIRLIFADEEIPAEVREPIALLDQQLADTEILTVEVRAQPT